ncbi:type IV secretion system protein [Rhodoferax sp. GW822-FHT02A01]|uniref:type IV secretion system protein n=1 Tax=Rhodoferax sp. GW822-FHT02A01 TaxID=3141537 RepID=UPI00315DE33C
MNSIFVGIGASIDSFLATYVNTVSAKMSIALVPLMASGITLWVILYGYSVMWNQVNDPVSVFLQKTLKFSMIMAIALGGGIYQSEIITAVYGFQDGIVAIMSSASGATSAVGNGGFMQILDDFSEKGSQLAFAIIGAGMTKLPMGGYLDLLAGVIVFAANVAILIVSGVFVLITKVAMAFVLGIGPLFIAALAFPVTAKFFEAWLGKVVNYALLVGLYAAMIGLAISICDSYLVHTMDSFNSGESNALADAFSLVTLYGVLIGVMTQVPHIASGLGGGASISSGGLGQMALGAAQKLIGGGSNSRNGDSSSRGSSGGDIENQSTAGGGRSNGGDISSGSAGSSSVPAYRRATMNAMDRKRK